MARSAVPISSTDLAIARNIRRAREALGLSQVELGRAMKQMPGFESWSAGTVSKVEALESGANPRRVSAAELFALAQVLGTEVAALGAAQTSAPKSLKRAETAGKALSKSLDQLDAAALVVLQKAAAFRNAHGELLVSEDYAEGNVPTSYSRLLTNASSRVIDSVHDLRRSIEARQSVR